MGSIQKSPLSTSLRSEIQATDSTWSGWSANTAATKAERQKAPVIETNKRKVIAAVAAWIAALTRWWPPGSTPNSWQSSMWESQVRGCQFAAREVVKAQMTPSRVRPAWTVGFSLTYMWS